jgi:hypothetical protein
MTDGETRRFDPPDGVSSAWAEGPTSSAALGRLLAALAAPADADEERAAARCVRVAVEAAAGASAPALSRGARLRRRLIEAKVAFLAGVAGAVLVAGVAGAATLGRLPRPVQHFAHDVLAPLGVPLPAGRAGTGDARARADVSAGPTRSASRTSPAAAPDRPGRAAAARAGAAPGSGGSADRAVSGEGTSAGRSTDRGSTSRHGRGSGRAGQRGVASGQPVRALSPGGTDTTRHGSAGVTPPGRSAGTAVSHPRSTTTPTTTTPTTAAPRTRSQGAAGRS